MRGYEDDEYEDYDNYEEEGYEQEEGGDEEDEYEEEEEEPKPTKEELEYLELRQKLKESIRKRMKKAASGSEEIKKDNYGSFFGPSKPVIAQRVIQESKSLLENQHLAARLLKSHQNGNKSSSSRPDGSKPGVRPQAPRVSQLKQRVQKIKDTRDYSFLLSDDAELPASPKQPPPRSIPAPSLDARSAKLSSQSRLNPGSNSRHVNGGREERRPASSNGHSNPRPGSSNGHSNNRPGSANGYSNTRPGSANGHSNLRPGSANVHSNLRPGSANGHSNLRPGSANGHSNLRPGSANGHSNLGAGPNKLSSASKPQMAANRKQLGSNSGNGPGRPAVSNGLQPKKPIPPPQRSSQGLKSSVPAGVKPPATKMQSSASKYQVEPRRNVQQPNKGKILSKHSVASTRPQVQAQMSKPQKQIPSHNRLQDQRPKKRPSRPFPEDDDDNDAAISMIRKMFGYNPQKFAGRDEDDSDMEANFDDIMREEKRSARIAQKEDEEQLRLIEEEERRERERIRKKRKMG
ncbi:protein SPT2 homolog isoform X1 [Punica granatum]|uniref:Protein SPT2 homolog isoform X1 n=1 Tax=Punica granatum TaxID=22663 RepID=A0A6P8CMH9_PUNGR|nr:protein SPT2 homolog isoform X1 [Punica granatum]XP_031385472.1 protein SPT2 homolog isoform X1 [Punica granatum]XP_031385473.1 protein SPT2 homolog isoform X1 [Punica granatum]